MRDRWQKETMAKLADANIREFVLKLEPCEMMALITTVMLARDATGELAKVRRDSLTLTLQSESEIADLALERETKAAIAAEEAEEMLKEE